VQYLELLKTISIFETRPNGALACSANESRLWITSVDEVGRPAYDMASGELCEQIESNGQRTFFSLLLDDRPCTA